MYIVVSPLLLHAQSASHPSSSGPSGGVAVIEPRQAPARACTPTSDWTNVDWGARAGLDHPCPDPRIRPQHGNRAVRRYSWLDDVASSILDAHRTCVYSYDIPRRVILGPLGGVIELEWL
jgi:hypothetical protein